MNLKNKLLILIIALILPSMFSCKAYWIERRQIRDMKAIEKKQREKEEEAMAEYQAKVQRHADIQSRKTRKEMKKNFRKYQQYSEGKKEFFLKRWFKKLKTKRSRPNNL